MFCEYRKGRDDEERNRVPSARQVDVILFFLIVCMIGGVAASYLCVPAAGIVHNEDKVDHRPIGPNIGPVRVQPRLLKHACRSSLRASISFAAAQIS
jgi:hypothetical protein